MGHSWGSLPICNARVRNNITQPGSIPYLSRIEFVELVRIIKPRERISDKGKLSERIGRKDTGLRPLKVMIAGLPKNLGYVTHTFSGMSFLLGEYAFTYMDRDEDTVGGRNARDKGMLC